MRPRLSSVLLTAILTLLALAIRAKSSPPQDDARRTGQPQELSRFARPIEPSRMIGYPVGGGAVNRAKAEPALPHEGTWGLDFTGGLLRRRVDLGWWHG